MLMPLEWNHLLSHDRSVQPYLFFKTLKWFLMVDFATDDFPSRVNKGDFLTFFILARSQSILLLNLETICRFYLRVKRPLVIMGSLYRIGVHREGFNNATSSTVSQLWSLNKYQNGWCIIYWPFNTDLPLSNYDIIYSFLKSRGLVFVGYCHVCMSRTYWYSWLSFWCKSKSQKYTECHKGSQYGWVLSDGLLTAYH